MTSLLAWAWGFICLLFASVFLWPWVNRRFPSPGEEWSLMRWPLTIGLSLGLLTLWMLLIGFWQLNTWLILIFPLVTFVVSLAVSLPKLQTTFISSIPIRVKQFIIDLLHANSHAWLLLAGSAMLIVVLAQATYYPFIGDDEISRYGYYARLIFMQGRITDSIRGYPLFMPLAYAFVFFTTGQLAEQLARLIPVILSIATVAATAALAWRWFGRRAAWVAACVLATSPLYLQWSPNGYIDIPSALYFVLCAYAADVWLQNRQLPWAALAGALAGLAMWTKQAGFAALACLGLVFAYAIVWDAIKAKDQDRSPVKAVTSGVVALAFAILLGGTWYLRNAYYDGWGGAVPGPGDIYYVLANHSPLFLIPFLGFYRDFGLLTSPLFIAGLLWAFIRFRRAAWLLVWTIPYTLLWWWLFSYDARFLLTVLPFYAIAFGGLLSEVRWPSSTLSRWGLAAAIMALTFVGLYQSDMGGWWQWLVAPTATYAQRLERAKGPLYPTAEYILNNLPSDAKLISMDGRLHYYLIDRDMFVTYPQSLAEVRQFDYFIVGSWWGSIYEPDSEVVLALDDPEILEALYWGPSGGLTVYRVIKP